MKKTAFLIACAAMFMSCTDTPPADPVIDPPPPVQRDTTSHDFVWEVDTIGLPFGMINDVSIVAENDIWVVGRFDQMGDDGLIDYEKRSNAAHWNGQAWTYHKAIDTAYKSCAERHRVFAANESNIWFMSVDGRQWDGKRFLPVKLSDGGFRTLVRALWISEDLNTRVFVGDNSSISFWDRGRYVRPWSVPPGDYTDVQGLGNGDVLISLRTPLGFDGQIHRMSRDGNITLVAEYLGLGINNFAVLSDSIYFNTNGSLYKAKGTHVREIFSSENTIHCFEANASNDYFVLTFPLQLHHFNGSTFKEIGPSYPHFFWPFALDVKGDLAVFVGDGPEQRSLIFRGKRRK